MTPSQTSPNRSRSALRALAILVCFVLGLLAVNTLSGGDNSSSGVASASLLTTAGNEPPAPTPVVTTPPLQIPTVAPTATPPPPTAVPTATAVPTPIAEPTATAIPPTAVPAPADSAVSDESFSAEAPAEAVASQAVEPAQVVPPTATALPAPTAETVVVIPEPTAPAVLIEEPTATPLPEPTPTPEPTPIPLQSAADLEQYVLGEINAVRARSGLAPVVLDPAISNISRDWSATMAARGVINGFAHRPSAELSALLPAGWREWGENIARAPDIFWAQSSLEQSPPHYANMVGNFTHVGVGVYIEDGSVWLTQNFARY